MSNDEKYNKYKLEKGKKILIITLSLVVIVLEFLALFRIINMVWGLILFIMIYFLKKMF